MKDLKKLLMELKSSCNKGILKPRHLEFEVEDVSKLSYTKLKSLLKEGIGHFNLEAISSLEYKLEDDILHLKLT